jgi:hypothetical protein
VLLLLLLLFCSCPLPSLPLLLLLSLLLLLGDLLFGRVRCGCGLHCYSVCEAWDAGRTLPGLTWVSFLLGNEHSMGKCRHLGASGRRGDGGEEPADIIASLLSVLLLLQSLPLSLPHNRLVRCCRCCPHCRCLCGAVIVSVCLARFRLNKNAFSDPSG